MHIPPKRYIPGPARSWPTVRRASRQGTWFTRSIGLPGFVPLNELAPSRPASRRSADVSSGLRRFENTPLRHGLGHVEPYVSEGTPCEPCHAKGGRNNPVNGLASNSTRKRLEIRRGRGLDQPQLQAILAVRLVEYTLSGVYAKNPIMLCMQTETLIVIFPALVSLTGYLTYRRQKRLAAQRARERLAWLVKAVPNSRIWP